MNKIVIVGANHAGTACINTILDNYGKNNEVIVFDRNDNISFLACGMALWIGKQIDSPKGLFYSSKELLEEKGAKVHIKTEVYDIDFDNKLVYAKSLDGKKEYKQSYDKLILATGSLPIIPNIEGKDLKNVQQVKLFQNAKDVIDKLDNDKEIKKVAVVGAGYIGVELAEAFKRWGKEVNLIDLAPSCLSTYYDQEFTKLMCKNLIDNNVNTHYGELVKKIEGKTKVEAVVTDKGRYEADLVCLAIGFRPNAPFKKDDIKLFRNGAYLVNKHQETSLKDVYAIGDCATVYDNSINDTSYIALASNALRSGIIAAHNVCGNKIEGLGVQGSNGISIFGLNMVSTGITENRAKKMNLEVESTSFEDFQKPVFIKEDNNKVKIKIVYDKNSRVILGCQIATRNDISSLIHMFSLAISEKVTIDKLALTDLFFLPHFNQPYNYVTKAALNVIKK